MRFLKVSKMNGEGCDYTIGCGMRFDWIEAESIKEAEELSVWPDGKDEYSPCDPGQEMHLTELMVIPESAVHIVDVESWATNITADIALADIAEKEAKERAELKRLQEKYE